MNRQGPAHQGMRPLGFPAPSAAAGRSAIGNGKLGGWPGAPPPGVPTPGSRPTNLTFSQSVGGLSQPSTPLDLSEFPALGGQTQSSTAQAWNRINTQSPSNNRATSQQLPPPSLSSQQPPSQPQQQQHESFSTGHKDIFGAMDDYRIPGTVAVGGSVGSGPLQSQMPPSSMDDFPALPRTTSGVALGGLDDRGGLGGIGQRQGVLGSRLLPQLDGALPQQQGVLQMGDAEKKTILKGSSQSLVSNGAPGLTNLGAQSVNLQASSDTSPAPGLIRPVQQQPQSPQPPTKALSANGDSFSEAQETLLAPPTDHGKYGLGTLVNQLRGEPSSLTTGQDLTQMGLDLNSSDGPLWPSFASPFAELEAKAVEPEFELPQCYTVHNTQPVHTKIQSFSDETLFYIFYTMPRDIMQEIVVAELAARNWRYHMLHRLWMTKDHSGQVEQFSENAEKGVYVFFDPTTWERVRKEIILEYSHLDPRTTGTYGGAIATASGLNMPLGATM